MNDAATANNRLRFLGFARNDTERLDDIWDCSKNIVDRPMGWIWYVKALEVGFALAPATGCILVAGKLRSSRRRYTALNQISGGECK